MKAFGYLLAASSIGALASATECPVADAPTVAHQGDAVGSIEEHNGVNMYITSPEKMQATTKPGIAVLYLTDVFGIQLLENKLLVDSFARAGYMTVAPDMFNGTPAPSDLNDPGFNTTAFLELHSPNATDPIVESAISHIRGTLGIDRIATAGYCFGGRYALRFLSGCDGADLAFAAHPSLLEDGEISGITGPASVAAADGDELMPPERRGQIEAMLLQTGQPYQLSLYGGTGHGFAVRANISNPVEKFGKEAAFVQATRWFDTWGQ
ncbi:dienelactone hydrolase family protein [Metarhizium brunneum]